MKYDRTSKREDIKFHLEYVNQRIDARTFTKRYYNQGKDHDEILECVERDMKQTHPEMIPQMLRKEINDMGDYLTSDGISIDHQIKDLITVRGYLNNALRPIWKRENRLFTPNQVLTKTLIIPFQNIEYPPTFKIASRWLGKNIKVVWDHMGVRTIYDHDELFGLCWKWLHEEKRANSYPKYGHYTTYHIPQSLLMVPGVCEIIKREQIQVA